MRRGMIRTPMKPKPEPKEVEAPKVYPDCLRCIWHKEVEYNLIQCKRPNHNPIPHPNCNVWKVMCVFFKQKEQEKKKDENSKSKIKTP